MPNIFDKIEQESKGNVFDRIESEQKSRTPEDYARYAIGEPLQRTGQLMSALNFAAPSMEFARQLREEEANRPYTFGPFPTGAMKITPQEAQGAAQIIGTGLEDLGAGAANLYKANLLLQTGDPLAATEQLGITEQQGIEKPYEEALAQLPTAGQIIPKAAEGLVRSTPRIGAMAAMSALAPPLAPAAGALAFGFTPEGFSPKEAAIAAALPYAGKYTGQLFKAIGSQLGVSTQAAKRILEASGHALGPTAYLTVEQASEIMALPEEERSNATIDSIASNIGMLSMSIPGMRGAIRSGSASELADLIRQSRFTPQPKVPTPVRRIGMRPIPTDQPFAQPGIRELAGAALDERMRGVDIPGREGEALGRLQRAIQPPGVVPVPTLASERLTGGGEAPYGKVSYMRRAEAPTTEGAQRANAAETETLQKFVDEESSKGAIFEQKQMPPGVRYRRPKEAPSWEEYQKQIAKENVEAGLTEPSGYYTTPEEVAAPPAETQATTISTKSDRPKPLVKPTVLSKLQRSRLRVALAKGAPEQVILNILRMSDKDIAKREAAAQVPPEEQTRLSVSKTTRGEPIAEFGKGESHETDMEFARRLAAASGAEAQAMGKGGYNRVNLRLARDATPAEMQELTALRDEVQKRSDKARLKAEQSGNPEDVQAFSDIANGPLQFLNEIVKGREERRPPTAEEMERLSVSRLYHGTRQPEFQAFDLRMANVNAYGPGFYFTRDPAVAETYAAGKEGNRILVNKGTDNRVIEADVSMDRVFPADKTILSQKDLKKISEAAGYKLGPFDKAYQPSGSAVWTELVINGGGAKANEILRKAGYDGIESSSEVVVFNPNQIKILRSYKLGEQGARSRMSVSEELTPQPPPIPRASEILTVIGEQHPQLKTLIDDGIIVAVERGEEIVRRSVGYEPQAAYNPRTKQVIFNAAAFLKEDGTLDVQLLKDKVVHEVAIHKGLRAAMGDKAFFEMTGDIWKNLSEAERQRIVEHQKIYGGERQLVGEEWLAYKAEDVVRTGTVDSTWAKIADVIRAGLRKLGVKIEYSDTEIARLVAKGWEGISEAVIAKDANIPSAAKRDIVTASDISTTAAAVDPPLGMATPRFSVRTWEATDKAKLVQDIVDNRIADRARAEKWMRDIENVAAFIIRNKDQLDYVGSTVFKALKENKDAFYRLSEDYSTICRKGAKFLATISEIMKETGGLTRDQMWQVRDRLREMGEEVTCAACYVWSRKIQVGPMLDEVAARFPNVPKDIIYDPRKSDIFKTEYPEAWKFLQSKGSGVGKAFEVRTEYNRDILKEASPEFVKRQNLVSGLRGQSWSDFEIYHLIDKMQSAVDKALVGLMGHSYTKVPEYVMLVSPTGEMVNMSLIPKGMGLDARGRLVFDDVEGMPADRAMALRKQYDKNAGTIIIGVSDAHIRAAMADGRIDYVIPYHQSGLNVQLRNASEMRGWMDYTETQKEGISDMAKFEKYRKWKDEQGFAKDQSEVRPWEYWDKKADGDTNAQNYLKYCQKNGIAPKFQQFAGEKGYWKLLVDRRMYDGKGKYIEQQPIKPTFDMKVVNGMLERFVSGAWKGAGDLTPNAQVVSEMISSIKKGRLGEREQIIREFRNAPPGVLTGGDEMRFSIAPTAAQAAMARFPAATPPPPPGPTPPVAAAAPSGTPAPRGQVRVMRPTLDDIYAIFEPEKKTKAPVGTRAVNLVEAIRTGFSSKFRPLNKLAEDIAKAYGYMKQDLAGIFEQLKGSTGRGEAQVFRFDRDVTKLVKGNEKDFSPYMFLRRSLDRLRQDLAEGTTRRQVGRYSIGELEAKLIELENKLGPDVTARFKTAADRYQQYMEDALKLQLESGRMSQEVYDTIRRDNQFYAPFKVMKYLEETMAPEGTGRKVDTVADFTKAMKGITSEEIKLGDMLAAARQSILLSRILADKANAMRLLGEQAVLDTQGKFIRKMFKGQKPPEGWGTVNVFENGKVVKYATRPEVVNALSTFGDTKGTGIMLRAMRAAGGLFRLGATTFNVPFQVSNLMADVPRAALVSKYGVRQFRDIVNYPLDFVHSLLTAVAGNVGYRSRLYYDFLDSGAAGTTIQEYLTPEALRWKDPSTTSAAGRVLKGVLSKPAEFATAIEQTSKILGIKRAMRFEGVTSGAELAKKIPEAITEIRRFSGSPDFGRIGSVVEAGRLNLLYMFLNARIQGSVADIGRIAGADGAKMAAMTWARTAAIALPTVYAYLMNNSPQYKDDYDKRPDWEKKNYWLIPKDEFITTEDGEVLRDYWRIPKREFSKWVANAVESAMNFSEKKDPKAFATFAQNTIEDIVPVNVTGKGFQERMESVGASLNPVIKAPLELATGRNLFRHRQVIPESMRQASPELQFTDRTSEAFKKMAQMMPDVAPEILRSPLVLENLVKNVTAGLITQVLPAKEVKGRAGLENAALFQRFQAIPYTDNEQFMKDVKALEREKADDYLIRNREAKRILDSSPSNNLAQISKQVGNDPKLLQQVVDLWIAKEAGATWRDRRLIALPARQRAEYIKNQLKGMTPQEKEEAMSDWIKKRVLTEAVFVEMSNPSE